MHSKNRLNKRRLKRKKSEKLRREADAKMPIGMFFGTVGKSFALFFKLTSYLLISFFAFIFIGLFIKNWKLAMHYVFNLSFFFIGIALVLSFIFSKKDWRGYSLAILGGITLFTSLLPTVYLTLEAPSYILFDRYYTDVVTVEKIIIGKWTDRLITSDNQYEFVSFSTIIPDEEIIEIDYLPLSKVGLGSRRIEK